MQIYNKLKSLGLLFGLSLSLLTGALGWTSTYAFNDIPGIDPYESAREAYRQGITAYDEGWYDLAFPALKYAAKRKIIGAQLTVAKMYAQGIWVRQSHPKAFDIYNEIREDNVKILSAYPRPKGAFLVAEAYVELAKYHNSGLAARGVRLDHREAFDLFMIAARSLGSAEAQYELAKMYISGRGARQNSRKAVRWLINADKNYNYPPAQALLGKIFWYGLEKRKKRPIFALAQLLKAKSKASKNNSGWIRALFGKIDKQASDEQRDKAKRLVAYWEKKSLRKKKREKKLFDRYQQNRDRLNEVWEPMAIMGKPAERKIDITADRAKNMGQFQNIDTPIIFSNRRR